MTRPAFVLAGPPLLGVSVGLRGEVVSRVRAPRVARSARLTLRCCASPTTAEAGEPVVAVGTGNATVSISGLSDPPGPTGPPAISSLADVQDIVRLAKEYDLADLRLEDSGVAVEISMPGGRGFKDGKLQDVPQPPTAVAVAPGGQVMAPAVYDDAEDQELAVLEDEGVEEEDASTDNPAASEEEADEDGLFKSDFVVKSDRVGFFFSGAKGKPPLVTIEDHVAFNQPVCIIEQLGQQYVYLSEVSGTVVKIFVEDGDPIEYGSKVMVIRPD